MRRALVVLAALALACKGATAPDPTTAGRWSGAFTYNSTPTTLTVTLAENANAISGSGSLGAPGGALAITVTGTRSYPAVALIIAAPGFNPIDFSGTFTNAATISGALNGSGYVNVAVTLARQ